MRTNISGFLGSTVTSIYDNLFWIGVALALLMLSGWALANRGFAGLHVGCGCLSGGSPAQPSGSDD